MTSKNLIWFGKVPKKTEKRTRTNKSGKGFADF